MSEVEFNGEEFGKILKIAKLFCDNGKSENPPNFVIIMGGVGVGKTTTRKQYFADGYVQFDFGEIYKEIKKEFGKDNPRLSQYATVASNMILQESLNAKKNIIIEIIGDKKEIFDPIIDKMIAIGYEFSVRLVTCDPKKAYKRHLIAAKEDKDYFSAYFTQEPTLSFFYQQFGLGEIPKMTP